MFHVQDGVVRAEWSFELARCCQIFAGEALEAEPETFMRAVSQLAKTLPAPRSNAEIFVLRDRLRIATDGAAYQFHAQFHRKFSETCRQPWTVVAKPLDSNDLRRGPAALLNDWATDFMARFADTHDWPAPIRAARHIRSSFELPFSVEQIARHVGCANSGLIRSFKSVFGMSMGSYYTRCRVRRGIELLRDPDSNVGEVAFRVGYHSTKNFYRALRELTGLTPTQLRGLTDNEAAALLDGSLSLPPGGWVRYVPCGSPAVVVTGASDAVG